MDTIAPPKLTNSEKASCILVVFVDNFVVSSNRAHNLSFLFCGLSLLCGEEADQDGGHGHPRGDKEETEGVREVTQGSYKVGNFVLRYL